MKIHRYFRPVDLVAWSAALLMLAYAAVSDAQAAAPPAKAAYAAECGSCHVAFPARLMSPAQWSQVMGALDRHYGVDASLDPAALATISGYLGVSPKSAAPAATTLPRITTSAWFRKEHDEVPSRVWALPAVKTAANCSACHTGADRGDFEEESVRLPK